MWKLERLLAEFVLAIMCFPAGSTLDEELTKAEL